ncbi:MAG: PD40 domain-containing protein [Deltaproteobacteria bacterium]|nr:PD40 domain-containing protein [Deltaproteobacteria bacterium]
MTKTTPRLILTVIFLLLSVSAASAANLDPSFKFSTIETPHFSIHFHQGLEEAASKAAKIAEEAHDKLSADFRWAPFEKTQMVLIDDSDYANGSATVLPYNVIFVQATPPYVDMTIGEYDDWLKMLIVHEYTHILTMDPARGYSKLARKIFGKPLPGGDMLSFLVFLSTAPPNVFLPRWWLEGIATWSETQNTKAGRGRSAYYEMVFRMAVAENNFPAISKINGEPPYWPNGHMPYMFGLRLHKYIADKYGVKTLADLTYSHSGRYPYFLNGVPSRLLRGENYVTLYDEMTDDLKKEQGGRIVALTSKPFTETHTISSDGEELTHPRYSPDGKFVAYNRSDPHEHGSIIIAGAALGAPEHKIRRRYSDKSVAWSPDSSRIYFAQAEVVGGFNIYSDLYVYDLATEKTERLTKGMRVKEPDASPDGKIFAVIVSERGNTNLGLLTFDAGEPKLEQLTSYKLMRVASPRWSPDGTLIVFVLKDNNGESSLNVLDVKTKETRILFKAPYDIASITWGGNPPSPRDGKTIIYSGDETGVFNLFSYSIADGSKTQITHVLGGAMHPDVSPDNKTVAFSSYSSTGFRIVSTDFNPQSPAPTVAITPYWIERGIAPSTEALSGGVIPPSPEAQGVASPPATPYSASKTLAPRFWLPSLSGDKDGSVIGAFTIGQDVLGYNTYYLEASDGTLNGEKYFDALYLNDYLYPTIILRAYSRPVLYADLLQKGDYYERETAATAAARVPFNRLEARYRLTIGFQAKRQSAQSETVDGRFKGVEVFEGRRNNAFVALDFSTSLKYPYSISREEGKDASIIYRYYGRVTGAEVTSREFIAELSEYARLPFNGERLRHTVIHLNFKGGVSSGDATAQQAFGLGGNPGQTEFPLRGFPSRSTTGKFAGTATAEMRSPVWYLIRGVNTKPIFFDRLHGAIFADTGQVWDDDTGFTVKRLKTGVGAELRLDLALGYFIEITPALGVAKGLNHDGTTQVYFVIYAGL